MAAMNAIHETFGAMYCKIGVPFGSNKAEDYFYKIYLLKLCFGTSSLSAHHSLIEYKLKDKLKALVLPERVFILFDMLTLSCTLRHYNDLNMIEGMRARVYSQFCLP